MKITKLLILPLLFFTLIFTSCSKPGDMVVQQAVAAFSAKEFDKALELFNQALNEESNYSEELIFNFIANVYAAQDDFENSNIYLEKALKKKADYRGFVTLGMNYQSLKNFAKAEENYQKAVKMNPEKGEAYASLGILYLEQNQTEAAIENLEKGARFAPKIAVIYANLAVAYAKAGRTEDSEKAFKTAEELNCVNLNQFEEKISALEK